MMAAPVVLVFVARDAIVKSDFARQATIGEQFEGAVNGGESDAWVGLFDEAMQFVSGEVLSRFEEGAQNCVALFGLFQADPAKVLEKNSFSLADALRRDGGLIVDSFLQHVGRRRNRR